VTPDFPRPILFKLGDKVRRLDTLTLSAQNFSFEGITGRIRDNLQEWLNNARESPFLCFDNLGISGAEAGQVLHDVEEGAVVGPAIVEDAQPAAFEKAASRQN
jgi:hypothetical protein